MAMNIFATITVAFLLYVIYFAEIKTEDENSRSIDIQSANASGSELLNSNVLLVPRLDDISDGQYINCS